MHFGGQRYNLAVVSSTSLMTENNETLLYKLRLSPVQRHEALGLGQRGGDGVREGKREWEAKRGDTFY